MSHLRSLEAEAIHIIREVAAEFERPVLLFSGGKAVVEVGGLLGPIDDQVALPDLVEGFGGVLEPGRDAPVPGVGGDDRIDIPVEHGLPAGVPLQGEPLM